MKEIKPKSPDTKLMTVGTVPDAIDAELVRNTLLDHEIDCQLDGDNQGGLTGMFAIGILVRDHDAVRAREIIGTHYPHLFGSG